MDLGDMRRDYDRGALDEAAVAADPHEQFARWFADAESALGPEANAMTLATADATGRPDARIVLLKGIHEGDFTFFTDYRSAKGEELAENPRAALLFYWPVLERQVRITGTVHRLDRERSAAYYHSRPEGSRLGAWASHQSAELPDRAALERQLAEVTARYRDGAIPLPPHWGGFRVTPDRFEFWQGRTDRLHDRFLFTRTPEHGWRRVRLSP